MCYSVAYMAFPQKKPYKNAPKSGPKKAAVARPADTAKPTKKAPLPAKKAFTNTKTPIKAKKPAYTAAPLTADNDRLERHIAHTGQASRREAKALIVAGKVQVNGVTVTDTGYRVIPGKDTVTVSVNEASEKTSYLFYKPRGIETEKIASSFSTMKNLAPIGRLDKESEGLIILSNDGVLARALTSEGTTVGKTYRVTVRENVTDDHLARMSRGIVLEGQKKSAAATKPAVTARLSRHAFTVVLHEGQKHQIRRMCAACKLTIDDLVRIGIGHLVSGNMKPGQHKKLVEKDVAMLRTQ